MASALCPELVGRREELAELRALLAGAPGRVLAVLGEAGVGKTRLVDELAAGAQAAGWPVLRGRATPGTGSPYRPVQEVLLAACRRGVPESPGLAPFRPALGRLVPQWRGEVGAAAEPEVVVAEGVLRLLDAVARAPGSGVLVVLEDLHWADRESLAVLEHLADHAAGTGVRVVATLRPEPGPGCEAVAALAARRALRVLPLAPLSPADVARMARLCLGTEALPAGLPEVLARADGLPFLVEELLGGGAVERVAGVWTVPAHAPWLVPRSLADAVAWKVAALPVPDRAVPRAAALLGRDVDPGLLAAVLGRPAADLEDVLERCVAAQLLAREEDGGFRFRHALTRDTVLAQLGPASRARLAGRALALVREAHPGLPGPWCTLAADLCRAAGDDAGAAGLLATAGRRALEDGALTSAGELLTAAAGLAGGTGGLRQEVDELLVDVAAQAGDAEVALARGGDLLARCTDPALGARVSLRMAEAATAAGRWDDAFAAVRRVGELTGDPAAAARADAVAAQALLGAGRLPEARDAAERALRRADPPGPAEAACAALQVLGRIARYEDLARAEQLFTRQLRVAETSGRPLAEISAAHELGTLDLMRRNDVGRLRQARDRAVRAGAVAAVATIDLQLAASAFLSWDTGAGLAAARRCQDTARLTGLGLPLAEAVLAEAAAHAIAGDRDAMEEAIARARAAGPMTPELEASAHARRGLHHLVRDDRAAATEAFAAAVAVSRQAPAPYLRAFWYYLALLRSGDPADPTAAERLRAEVRPATPPGTATWALLRLADAVAAGRAGRGEDAAALAAEARRLLDPPGLRAQRSLGDRLVAEAALADGWGRPVEWLTEAAGFFRATGRTRLERACRSLLRSAGAPLVLRDAGHRTVPPELAARGITDREADVLALVREGLTSTEIARELFISPRTVDKHVERLLAKTGCTRRGQLRRLRTR